MRLENLGMIRTSRGKDYEKCPYDIYSNADSTQATILYFDRKGVWCTQFTIAGHLEGLGMADLQLANDHTLQQVGNSNTFLQEQTMTEWRIEPMIAMKVYFIKVTRSPIVTRR